MIDKESLLKGTIFDQDLRPFLLESERKLSRELKPIFLSKIEHLKKNWTVFCSLAPLSMLYFHIRLALLLRHIQNIKGRIFLLNLDHVTLAHANRKYYKYYPLEGKKRFISLLNAVGVNTESKRRFRFADWRLLNSRVANKDEYFRYIHALDMVELVDLVKFIKETSGFRKFIDFKAYADDIFIASTVGREEFNNCDFIAGSIDRVPVYIYCSKVLTRDLRILPPMVMPFASMPVIEVKRPEPYPAINDARKGGTIKRKLKEARLQKRELILLIKTLLEFYEEVTGKELATLDDVRDEKLNTFSLSKLMNIAGDGMEELFLTLSHEMEPTLPPEVKEFTTREDLKGILLSVGGSQHLFRILEKILDNPKGVTASEIHKSTPDLDKTTTYRTLERLENANLITSSKLGQPKKYYPVAKKINIRIESS